jgi:glyoxylase-like metal-dependent hydrolase (beta-lactamase superfamily II)
MAWQIPLPKFPWLSIALTLSLSLSWLSAYSQQIPVTLTQIGKNAYYAEGVSALGSPLNRNFISNAGVVVGPDGVIVIDALGSPALGQQLIAEISKITNKPIQFVIVTHYHADHIYGLQSFVDIGATIIAQTSAKDYLTSDTAQLRLEASRTELAPWINAQTRLVPATQWITDDTRLKLAGLDVDLIKMGPAHTADDLAVFFPSEAVLFAGDLVFRGRIPYVGNADSLGWIKSLDKLLSREATTIVPGHGPASTSPKADLQFTRDYLIFVRQAMEKAARELEPFDEAYAATDWSRYEKIPLFNAANRMNAYNIYLSIQNE